MATLTGNAINTSYQGLIKTDDNAAFGAAEKRVTDGLGNATNMTIGTGGTSFDSGTVNFTGATVTGLPGGSAGLVSGTGTDSMQSAASLTTLAANASGTCSIALGNNASGAGQNSIALGLNANATGIGHIAIGCDSQVLFAGGSGMAIGALACSNGNESTALGYNAKVFRCSVAVGGSAGALCQCSTAVGRRACTTNLNGIAIGTSACATGSGSTAIGVGVTAAKADTVTVKELETCVAGGGITLKSADLTEEKMTLTDADVLAVGGDTIPANDSATPTVVNRIWSGSQAQYDALGTYDANTLYYIA